MAENRAVWGIDIGQAGLKAIRLKYAEQAGQALAVAFDYIPHPKILSQPDAIPKDLIRQALATFLERNDVAGDAIAISLPGHSALARFIELPPVESSKVADVVKYEARQQIPFALEDVIWDFQTLGGGMEESGFMLGAEVGLFAMKKEQVYEAMKPFDESKVEVDLIQIAPLGMYNFLCYDKLGMRLGDDDFVAPSEFTIMLDMGTDNTTLLVTNGEKIWIRNVPLGGNHFTRALTKEMKLTFAKAEHLKCNATKSPDPRAVFQALRPIFNDYVNEIQRSIGYFSSVNRDAKIGRVVGVGNGFKLAGLQKFLQQNLQYEVERIESFDAVIGDTVLNAPVFQENIMSFVVPYGLALQALKVTKIHTTLLPPEIATARKIRRKKPWAVTTAAALLGGLSISVAAYANSYNYVFTAEYDKAKSTVEGHNSKINSAKSAYDGVKSEHAGLVEKGEYLFEYKGHRELWIEVFRAVDEALPRPVDLQRDETDIRKIPRINVLSLTAKRESDLGSWFSGLSEIAKQTLTEDEKSNGPSGEGYVFTLKGEHYYVPEDPTRRGIIFVHDTLLQNLKLPFFKQPDTAEPVPIGLLGISHPVVTDNPVPSKVEWYPNGPPTNRSPAGSRNFNQPGAVSGIPGGPVRPGTQPPGAAGEDVDNRPIQIDRTTFTLQFAWKPTLVKDRVMETEPTGGPATAPVEQPANPADANAGMNPGVPVGAPGSAPGQPAVPGGQPLTPVVPGDQPVQGDQPNQGNQAVPNGQPVPGT
ncbi:type IV pilus assembly protein PilM [bacterium]|nr:type IV pilus assembly protein PilM [bacterium]